MTSQRITPFLWFEKGGDEAANYYCSIFKNAKIIHSNPMVTEFELDGLRLCILSGGPQFKLDEAFSLSVPCDTQEEIDYYWNRFVGDGGEESMCGWCKDKYGVSWQVVPSELGVWMSDPVKGPRVMQAFLKMKKFDIATLENA
jgi:predicted 3-demethylubiquinone-9 3-methyltransferase (glyoxalase superfamily)